MIGLMSGTSMDAIDGCCVKLWHDEQGFHHEVLSTGSKPMPRNIRDRVMACINNKGPVLREICSLNMVIGQLFADVATMVMYDAGLRAENINGIGSHGQTVWHQPPLGEGLIGSTLQIGEPTVIAERLGVTTVGDFRVRDIAVGGQGAPLVCYADQLLFQDDVKNRCVQNIGGIANVTVLPSRKSSSEVIAFDTGPGNMLIDLAMRHFFERPYDEDGAIAASGTVNQTLFDQLISHEYLGWELPKTTGREMFGDDFFKQLIERHPEISPQDWVSTLTAFTVQSIAGAYEKFVFPTYEVEEVIVGGGGVKNKHMMVELTSALKVLKPDICVVTHDDFDIDNQYKEALAFAILGWATLTGQAGNIPSCTGADRPAVLGKIIL